MLSWFAGKSIGSIASKLAPYIAFGLVVLIIGWLWKANQDLNQELGRLEGELETALLANRLNVAEIEDLIEKNNECVDLFKRTKESSLRAIEQLEAERDRLKAERDNAEGERIEIFRQPECNELGQIDINSICPSLAERLRLQARDSDRS